MSTTTQAATTQVYRVHIRATPQAVWDAITRPEWTERYGYASRVEYSLYPGGHYRGFANDGMKAAAKARGVEIPDVVVDGEVIEADPPRRLVQTFRMLTDAETAGEGFTRLTYEIEETQPGVTKLTLVHELEGAPRLAVLVGRLLEAEGAGGGWSWVLSDLKSLLETGKGLSG